jgi:hypothetical protein
MVVHLSFICSIAQRYKKVNTKSRLRGQKTIDKVGVGDYYVDTGNNREVMRWIN